MRRLILMRHAKSSWDNPGLGDHARPLNKRGRTSAAALGSWLREQEYLPDEVFCSTSERTRETLQRLRIKAETRFEPSLYHAGTEELFSVLTAATEPTVLIIGHNPGIGDFANRVVNAAPHHERFQDYPTGATLVAEFENDHWVDCMLGQAIARDFVIPREL